MENLQDLFFKYFLNLTSIREVSSDKMMIKSLGPVWHKKQKEQNIIPKGLRGVDRQAQWGYSKADGWVYGHGSYCTVSHNIPVIGKFKWIPNNRHEGKEIYWELIKHKESIDTVCFDSKADDSKLFKNLKNFLNINLLTVCRRNMDKTFERKSMIQFMNKKKNKKIYRQRSVTVEPMQGLIANIFDLSRSWMRGDTNNRWITAAQGVAVQIAQLNAYLAGESTWKVKEAVLGV